MIRTIELRVGGMDCAECTQHVSAALEAVPGVTAANVLLGAEKAFITFDPAEVTESVLHQAIAQAGYTTLAQDPDRAQITQSNPHHQVLLALGLIVALVLLISIFGEGFGLIARLTALVPWPLWLAAIVIAGWPVFRSVLLAIWHRQINSHMLMTMGMLAAIVVGQWVTALLVVIFMRLGAFIEQMTTERSRHALRDLTALAPRRARVAGLTGDEVRPIAEVSIGAIVVVRPGEQIPVDGIVRSGTAAVNQATLTGESMPQDAQPGTTVLAASLVLNGSLRIETTSIGAETAFGRVIRLVEEAETHRADIQRIADRFAAGYLPVVAVIAILTFVLTRNALATAAVLVVACSCSFALATPVAIFASVGAAAKQGILFRGGKYVEALAQANVLLVDKTGTLTLGRPRLVAVVPVPGWTEDQILTLAGTAEYDSEHPLAMAIRDAATTRGLTLQRPDRFIVQVGQGVEAVVAGKPVTVGRHTLSSRTPLDAALEVLAAQGHTVMLVHHDGQLIGALAAADTLRPEVAAALQRIRDLGITQIEMLTGDNAASAAMLAQEYGIAYQASLFPEEKIRIVQAYQARGQRVIMVGDGINDAPALAQADVGIAMGASGTAIAQEAAHVVLMRDDWLLVPDALHLAQRTMRVVRVNLGLAVVYNLIGLTLAAFGVLPPILAAAAQAIPDVGIMTNSARLIRVKTARPSALPEGDWR